MGTGGSLSEAEYSFYIRPNTANFALIYDYRNKNNTITPVVYRTNATDLYSGGTPGVVRFGYSTTSVQNLVWRVEVTQRSNNVTFYPTNTGSAVVTTNLVHVTPAPFTKFDSNVAVGGSDLFVDTVGNKVGIGTNDPTRNGLNLYTSGDIISMKSSAGDKPEMRMSWSGTNAENFSFYDVHGSGSGFLYGRKYTTGTTANSNAGWKFHGNDNAVALTIVGSSANVGVGTIAPSCPFEVKTAEDVPCVRFGTSDGILELKVISSQHGFETVSLQTYIDGGTNGGYAAADRNVLALQPITASRVGIGTTQPLRKLHLKDATGMMIEDNGSTSAIFFDNVAQGTGNVHSYILNAPRPGTNSGGAVHYINAAGRSDDGGVSTYTIRNDSGPIAFGRNDKVTTILGSERLVSNGDNSRIIFGPNASFASSLYVGATGGGAFDADEAGIITTNGNLHLDAGGARSGTNMRSIYLNHYSGGSVIFQSTPIHTSDDRVKTGEKFIENALTTLKKLKPQTYLHHTKLNDGTSECRHSAGLIAQEVYYQCPELKYIVSVPYTAHVDLEKEIPDDPQNDPDYSDWGEEPAAIGYGQLIPYTISAIKQLSNEGTRHKVRVSNISFSNVLEYHGLVVSKNSNVYVSNVENDTRVYGVISDVKAETNDSEVLVNYRGDGKIWVINTDNIQAGDYITTSNVPGYATKQEGDTLRSYTIAKSSIDCDFTQPMIDEKRVTQKTITTSRWKNKGNVRVLEATYSNLSDDVRFTENKVVYINSDENKISSVEYSRMSSDEQNDYTPTTVTDYYYKSTRYVHYNKNSSDWIEESTSKTVDSLDDNGQVIWENTGTQVSMYPIKYLTSSGTETEQSNAAYTAALIDCSILGA
jgi:hypothetical protein